MSTNSSAMAQKNIRVVDEPEDVISDLPSEIKEKILVRMPICDAARTSALSRKWTNLWRSLPQLVFDKQFFDHAKIYGNKKSWGYEFAILINEILLLHRHSVLTKFHLVEPDFFSDGKRYLEKWILFLSRNEVKELALDNSASPTTFSYTLPSCLFSCLDLVDLNLCNYTLRPPASFTGFPRLVSLHFNSINFATNSTLETVISSSPQLERLTIEHCEGVNGHFAVDALNLKYLCICFYRFVYLKRVPNLQEATFMWSKFVDCRGDKVSLVDILRALPRLEKLTVDGFLLEDLVPAGVPEVVNHQLKNIQLLFVNCKISDQVSNALFLIRSSVNLQELKISAGTWPVSSPGQDIIENMEEPDWILCNLDQLRRVKMESLVIGWRSEMTFIEYLLVCSPNLKSMHITCSSQNDLQVLSGEMLRFQPASQQVAVSFELPPELEPQKRRRKSKTSRRVTE